MEVRDRWAHPHSPDSWAGEAGNWGPMAYPQTHTLSPVPHSLPLGQGSPFVCPQDFLSPPSLFPNSLSLSLSPAASFTHLFFSLVSSQPPSYTLLPPWLLLPFHLPLP